MKKDVSMTILSRWMCFSLAFLYQAEKNNTSMDGGTYTNFINYIQVSHKCFSSHSKDELIFP